MTRVIPLAALAVMMSVMGGRPLWARGVTCDGDISDIRAFSQPGAPAPIELTDPDGGFWDSVGPSSMAQAGGWDPSGFNVGSIVAAYDPVDHAYYIGLDVSSPAWMDTVFETPAAAWDSDGDGDPNSVSDGQLMSPSIDWDLPLSFDGADEYRLMLDIGHTHAYDAVIRFLWEPGAGEASPPVVSDYAGNPLPGLVVTAAPVNPQFASFAGDGPDIEFCIEGLDVAFPSRDERDFRVLELYTLANTYADFSSDDRIYLTFEFGQPPACQFGWGPATPAAGLPVAFDSSQTSDPNGAIAAWAWDFGDGATSTDPNPAHVYAGGGCMEVTLAVTDDEGLCDTRTQVVPVRSATEVPLADAGWHLVSAPHSEDHDLAEITVRDDRSGASLPFCDAADTWVQNPLFAYDSAGRKYDLVGCAGLSPPTAEHSLRMGSGYWLYTFQPELTLVFP
jgi:PKD repeat protein